jgi:formylglycine-generating enzyme required for sulfatase activity
MRRLNLAPLLLVLTAASAHAVPPVTDQKTTPPAQTTKPAVADTQNSKCTGLEISVGAEPRCLKPGAGEAFRDCPTCPEMVVVPSGSFTMGSPPDEAGQVPAFREREHPQHQVTIKQPFSRRDVCNDTR